MPRESELRRLRLTVEETHDGQRISDTISYSKSSARPTPAPRRKFLAGYFRDMAERIERKEAIEIGFAEDSMRRIYREELLLPREPLEKK